MAATAEVEDRYDDHPSDSEGYSSDGDYQHIDDQGECILTHDNYTSDLASHLNQLRKAEALCDITIVVEKRRFPAHRTVLSAASSYFSAMFTSGFSESNQKEITIDGNSDAFERLLDFAYTGVIRLNTELIHDIISSASYLQFNKVVPLCSQFLKGAYAKKLIHLADAFAILNMALLHEFPLVQKHAEKYLAKNFVDFCETEVFLKEASADYVGRLLYRKDLVLWVKEEQILTGVKAWLKQDWEDRQQYAEPFLRLIRLGLIPIANLKQLIDSDMQAIPECKEMIEEVEKCLALKETSKTPLSFQFPHLFTSRGTVTRVIMIDPGVPTVACHERRGWQELDKFAKIPFEEPFTDHQVIVVNGELYLAGGSYRMTVMVNTLMLATLHCDHFYRYDRIRNQWVQLPSMIAKRSCFSMMHHNGFIYAIGGKSSLSNRFEQRVERFHLDEQRWEEMEVLPAALRTISSVVYQNVILVYGLRCRNTGGIGRQATLFAFDPVRKTWATLLSEFLPVNRTLEASDFNPNIPPALVVEKGKCYRIVYYGSRAPRLNQVNIDLAGGSATLSNLHCPEDQEFIGKRNTRAGAFVINKRVFVNLNGYIHRLAMHLGTGNEEGPRKDEKSEGHEVVEKNNQAALEEDKKASLVEETEHRINLEASNESTGEKKRKETHDEEDGAPSKRMKLDPSLDVSEDRGKASLEEKEVEADAEPFSTVKLMFWEESFTLENIPAVEFTFDKYLVSFDSELK